MSLADPEVWKKGRQHLRKADPAFVRIIKGKKGRFQLERRYFQALVESIIFQQLAGKAAQAILSRFLALYENRFPSPAEVLQTADKRLRSAGVSPQKLSYLRDLARRIQKGRLSLEKTANLPDEQVIETLDAVKGIGRWTAEMFLIFSLGRPDVLPIDDLGLRKAIQQTYRLRELPTPNEILELAKPWHPYCSLATLYLWRSQTTP